MRLGFPLNHTSEWFEAIPSMSRGTGRDRTWRRVVPAELTVTKQPSDNIDDDDDVDGGAPCSRQVDRPTWPPRAGRGEAGARPTMGGFR